MIVLDILANNDWERPVYFAVTVSPDNFLNMTNFFQMDGLAYRFVPLHASQTGGIDADILYDRMMNRFQWGNVSDPSVYICETNSRLLSHFRSNFGRLANALLADNKKDSAILALNRAYEVIPVYQLPLGRSDLSLMEMYYRAEAKEKGDELAEKLFKTITEELEYLMSFPRHLQNSVSSELHNKEVNLYHLCSIARRYESENYDTYRIYWNMLFPNEPLEALMQYEMDDDYW